MNLTEDFDEHPVFRNDVMKLHAMLYCHVELTSSDGCVHNGRVVSIDPVSESWVLASELESGSPVLEVMFGHSVRAVRTVSSQCDERTRRRIDSLLGTLTAEQSGLSPAAVRARRDRVVAWLRSHRLPVSVSGDRVTVAGVATLHPPYTADDCVCDNELVLQRLDALLRTIPDSDQDTPNADTAPTPEPVHR